MIPDKLSRLLFAAILVLCACFAHAQTPVILAPYPQLQFFDQTGTPLSFGCVFTYQTNSVTPLATYTDYTGTTLNSNPVILSAGGSANIWLAAGESYAFRVKSAGGSNCANGTTLYTVNGLGGGTSTVTTVVPYSPTPAFPVSGQNQLFQITLTGNASAQAMTFVGIVPPSFVTFQITQDGSGGHLWSWPTNSIGGATVSAAANSITQQTFLWNGTVAIAVGPATYDFGGTSSGFGVTALYDFNLTPLSTVCTDVNSQLVSGSACAIIFGITVNGQAIPAGGSGNVNNGQTAHSIALNEGNGNAIGGLSLALNQIPVGQTSADPTNSTIPTCATGTHLFFGGTLPLTCTSDVAIGASTITQIGTTVSVPANSATNWVTKSVTMPSTGCPCRALVSYGMYFTTGNSGIHVAWADDSTNIFASTQLNGSSSFSNAGMNGTSMSPVTYANSAVVVFHGVFETSASGGATVQTANNSGSAGAQNSWINIAIMGSN